jgi:hypothetical protein
MVDGVVQCSHQLDTGRTLLRASVRTLSDVMTDIVIPARVQLREMSHDLQTWRAAEVKVLDKEAFLAVTWYLHRQVQYTDALLNEYAKNKPELAELAWHAEQAKTPTGGAKSELERDAADASSRRRRSAALAAYESFLKQRLPTVHDYIYDTGKYAIYNTGKYATFREFYIKTLEALRGSLQDGKLLKKLATSVPKGWDGIKLVRLDTLGRILAGQEAGRVVEVVDDAVNTGGFLILTYSDVDRSPEVYDSRVESIVDVELYFGEKGWDIEWLDR